MAVLPPFRSLILWRENACSESSRWLHSLILNTYLLLPNQQPRVRASSPCWDEALTSDFYQKPDARYLVVQGPFSSAPPPSYSTRRSPNATPTTPSAEVKRARTETALPEYRTKPNATLTSCFLSPRLKGGCGKALLQGD